MTTTIQGMARHLWVHGQQLAVLCGLFKKMDINLKRVGMELGKTGKYILVWVHEVVKELIE